MATSSFSMLVFLFLGACALAAPATTAAKKTHLHFYFHDVRGGPNATSLNVASLGMASGFGDIGVFDNAMTEGPVIGTKAVGRGQGMVVVTQLDGQAIMTSLNFVFADGKYNGSSLALFGHAALSSEFADRAIVGGSGAFRGARGYAISKVVSASPEYLIAEFNVYVDH